MSGISSYTSATYTYAASCLKRAKDITSSLNPLAVAVSSFALGCFYFFGTFFLQSAYEFCADFQVQLKECDPLAMFCQLILTFASQTFVTSSLNTHADLARRSATLGLAIRILTLGWFVIFGAFFSQLAYEFCADLQVQLKECCPLTMFCELIFTFAPLPCVAFGLKRATQDILSSLNPLAVEEVQASEKKPLYQLNLDEYTNASYPMQFPMSVDPESWFNAFIDGVFKRSVRPYRGPTYLDFLYNYTEFYSKVRCKRGPNGLKSLELIAFEKFAAMVVEHLVSIHQEGPNKFSQLAKHERRYLRFFCATSISAFRFIESHPNSAIRNLLTESHRNLVIPTLDGAEESMPTTAQLAAREGNVEILECIASHNTFDVRNELVGAHSIEDRSSYSPWMRSMLDNLVQRTRGGIVAIAARLGHLNVLDWMKNHQNPEIRRVFQEEFDSSGIYWATATGNLELFGWIESDPHYRNLFFGHSSNSRRIVQSIVDMRHQHVLNWIRTHSKEDIRDLFQFSELSEDQLSALVPTPQNNYDLVYYFRNFDRFLYPDREPLGDYTEMDRGELLRRELLAREFARKII